MKHVFSIHSPITFLVTYAVIEHLKLDKDDVIVLSNDYKTPIDKYKSFPLYSDLNRGLANKIANFNTPVSIDRYLGRILKGEEFIAYIDLMSFYQRTIITHKNCVGFNFLEEGNANYRDSDSLEDLTFDKQNQSYRLNTFLEVLKEMLSAAKWAARGYSQRLLSIPFSFTNYAEFSNVKYFGLSDFSHPTISKEKKIVVQVKPTAEVRSMAANISLNECIVWIDGSGKSFTKLDDKIYHQAIEKGIMKLNPILKSKQILLKLRPGIDDYSSNYLYNSLTQKGFEVSVMRNNLIIECVFACSSNCIVIGNLSSALFYSTLFGHKAYSIYSLFEERAETHFDKMSGFWSRVEML